MTCPTCQRGHLVEIGVTLSEHRVTMHNCSRCETRWWDREGETVDLGGVLALVPARH